ncbi:pseudouridine synthase [Sporosarcina gallistercoris]|uniref:Pseudouridine synthase n=1 Tax=Sporosarcina gallistercoris TaxID=2762245 RepID=A0ABR8PIA4_9BACL|nr:pseudouridine synthase [Sporosarcina gallistercoris]MBD7907889.1 rRNA pseudouridine synthase [Sporosarcina gallistercoris]
MRLDKLLGNNGFGTRKDVKQLIRKGTVRVNGVAEKDPGAHVNPDVDSVDVLGEPVIHQEFIYIMMNKPPGVISATEDKWDQTVIDLLSENEQRFEPFPVGRLDKDTEGLLLITNDGKLTHELLSPKKDIPKTYYAKIDGIVTGGDVEAFKEGVTLEDGFHTKPGILNVLVSDSISEIELTITEGKFHQVKRMFEAVDKKVIYLKRLSMGNLLLDESLPLGHYRELTDQELNELDPRKKG